MFAADDGTGDKWFATNGTSAGTFALGNAAPIHGGKVFFTALGGGKLEMFAADLVATGTDAGPDAPIVVDSGGSSGSTSSSGSSSGGKVIDDPSADGVPVSELAGEESGCSIAAPGTRRKRGR